jgi:hypothetical protein
MIGSLTLPAPYAPAQFGGPQRLLPPRGATPVGRWAGLVEGRGACHHPDGSVRFIRSALRVFAGEASLHEQGICTGANAQPFLPQPDDPPHAEED